MRYIGYLRVSTKDQELGLEAQEEACREYCRKLGVEVYDFYSDKVSGDTPLDKRPGILDAIAALKKGDVILVAKRDRISRGDIMAIAMIEAAIARKGASIVSVAGEGTQSGDPSALLMRRMIDAFAEYEKLIIRARTKSALQVKKSKGERISRFIPFGYKLGPDGIKLNRCESEQRIIQLIRDLQASGLTMVQIAEELNKRDIKNRGVIWSKSSVHRRLQAA